MYNLPGNVYDIRTLDRVNAERTRSQAILALREKVEARAIEIENEQLQRQEAQRTAESQSLMHAWSRHNTQLDTSRIQREFVTQKVAGGEVQRGWDLQAAIQKRVDALWTELSDPIIRNVLMEEEHQALIKEAPFKVPLAQRIVTKDVAEQQERIFSQLPKDQQQAILWSRVIAARRDREAKSGHPIEADALQAYLDEINRKQTAASPASTEMTGAEKGVRAVVPGSGLFAENAPYSKWPKATKTGIQAGIEQAAAQSQNIDYDAIGTEGLSSLAWLINAVNYPLAQLDKHYTKPLAVGLTQGKVPGYAEAAKKVADLSFLTTNGMGELAVDESKLAELNQIYKDWYPAALERYETKNWAEKLVLESAINLPAYIILGEVIGATGPGAALERQIGKGMNRLFGPILKPIAQWQGGRAEQGALNRFLQTPIGKATKADDELSDAFFQVFKMREVAQQPIVSTTGRPLFTPYQRLQADAAPWIEMRSNPKLWDYISKTYGTQPQEPAMRLLVTAAENMARADTHTQATIAQVVYQIVSGSTTQITPDLVSAASAAVGGQGIPIMITEKLVGQLLDLGYDKAAIQTMRPEEAWAIVLKASSEGKFDFAHGRIEAPETPTGVVAEVTPAQPAVAPVTPTQAPAQAPVVAEGATTQAAQQTWRVVNRKEGETLVVEAVDAKGNVIGRASFLEQGENIIYDPKAVLYVEPENRRQGIATAIVEKAQELTGKRLLPERILTPLGRTFQEAYFGRPAVATQQAPTAEKQATEGTVAAPVAAELPTAMRPRVEEAPVMLRGEIPQEQRGRETVAQDPNNKKYRLQYAVVELESPLVSHLDNLEENPTYPQKLQPRSREKLAYVGWMNKTVEQFTPEMVLGENMILSSSTPIVRTDNTVLSGNGRILVMKRVARENPAAWAEYQTQLRESLANYGLDEKAIVGMKNPILVRINNEVSTQSIEQQAKFAAIANAPVEVQLGSPEQIKADAKLISTEAMANLLITEDESISEALRKVANKDIVQEFASGLPDTERNAITSEEGTISGKGIERIKWAMLYKTYSGMAGERLISMFSESTSDDVKIIQAAMERTLPQLARAEALVAAGVRAKSLSFAPLFGTAVQHYIRAKHLGLTVKQYISQGNMFGGQELSPLEAKVLAYLDVTGARSKNKLTAFLAYVAKRVEGSDQPGQLSITQLESITLEGILNDAIAKTSPNTAGNINERSGLFGKVRGVGEEVRGRVEETTGTGPENQAPGGQPDIFSSGTNIGGGEPYDIRRRTDVLRPWSRQVGEEPVDVPNPPANAVEDDSTGEIWIPKEIAQEIERLAKEKFMVSDKGKWTPQLKRYAKVMTGKDKLEDMTAAEQKFLMDALNALPAGKAGKPPKIPTTTTVITEKLAAQMPLLREIGYIERGRAARKVFGKIGLYEEVYRPAMEAEVLLGERIHDFMKELHETAKLVSRGRRAAVFDAIENPELQQSLSVEESQAVRWFKKFFDDMADELNLPPEKRRQNYITHIFEEAIANDLKAKHPLDVNLLRALDFVTPGRMFNPYLQERLGREVGLLRDPFKAAQAYALRAFKQLAYEPILQRIKAYEKLSPPASARYLRAYAQRMAGRPSNIDTEINTSLKEIADSVEKLPHGKVVADVLRTGNVAGAAAYGLVGLQYLAWLGGRPASAIKNLSQQGLIIAETGLGPYVEALAMAPTQAGKEAARQSMVLRSRVVGSLPGIDQTYIQGLNARIRDTSMWMFTSVDKVNVRAAFLAGYIEATRKGLPPAWAIKRGDEVAEATQFVYTKLAGTLWAQSSAGRILSTLTTWPGGWLELMSDWAKGAQSHTYEEYFKETGKRVYKDKNKVLNKQFLTYLSIVALLYGVEKNSNISASQYSGWSSLQTIAQIASGDMPGLEWTGGWAKVALGAMMGDERMVKEGWRSVNPLKTVAIVKQLVDIYNGDADWLSLFIYLNNKKTTTSSGSSKVNSPSELMGK